MKPFYEKDIPQEVKEYMSIVAGTGGMMGLKLYQKCKAIEDKYPEWFPWEHKYQSIPQEVHDAYKNEKYSLELHRKGTSKIVVSFNKPLLELIKEWKENLIKEQEIDKKQLRKDKELWDKHYKKYRLKFRN